MSYQPDKVQRRCEACRGKRLTTECLVCHVKTCEHSFSIVKRNSEGERLYGLCAGCSRKAVAARGATLV